MTWVKIDDKALLHPKLLEVGPESVCLWVAGLGYANAHHTDGVLPKRALPAFYPSDRWTKSRQLAAAKRLVEAKLWLDDGDSWRIHDYAEYQEEALRENVAERREYERQRKAALRARKKNESLGEMSRRDSPGHVPGTEAGHVPGTHVGQSDGTHVGQSDGTRAGTGAGTSAPKNRDECPGVPHVSQPPGPARPGPARPVPSYKNQASSDDALSEPQVIEMIRWHRSVKLACSAERRAVLRQLAPVKRRELDRAIERALDRNARTLGAVVDELVDMRKEDEYDDPPVRDTNVPLTVETPEERERNRPMVEAVLAEIRANLGIEDEVVQ